MKDRLFPSRFAFAALLASVTLVNQSQAASAVFSVPNGDWNTASNWQISGTALVPSGTDTAFLRGDRVANITTSATAQVINMSNIENGGAGTINISSTGILGVAAALTTNNAVTMGNVASGTGTINLNGGLMTVSGITLVGNALGSYGEINVNSGTFSTGQIVRVGSGVGARGSLNVSGGRFATATLNVGYSGTGVATISGGTVATTTLSVSTINGSQGSLSISSGRLEVTNDAYIGERVTGTTNASYTQSGGTVLMGTSGTSRLMIGATSSSNHNINSTATISGGTYEGRFLIGAATGAGGGNGVLTIVGDDAIIGSTSSVGNGIELRASGRIVFQLDATGVSTLNYANSNVAFSAGSDLWVDGSAYLGGAQILTLIHAGSFSGGSLATIDESIFGFAPGYTTNLFFDGMDLKLEITGVPEPSTWALLGLGLGMAVWQIRKRRMAKA